jgi:hypothetical protein
VHEGHWEGRVQLLDALDEALSPLRPIGHAGIPRLELRRWAIRAGLARIGTARFVPEEASLG